MFWSSCNCNDQYLHIFVDLKKTYDLQLLEKKCETEPKAEGSVLKMANRKTWVIFFLVFQRQDTFSTM